MPDQKMRSVPAEGSVVLVGDDSFVVKSVKLQSADAVTPPSLGLVIVYPSADGWRWRLTRKGRVLCDSGQNFRDRKDAAVRSVDAIFCGLYPIVTVGPS